MRAKALWLSWHRLHWGRGGRPMDGMSGDTSGFHRSMVTRFAGILGAACLLVWLSALRASGAEPVSDGQIIHVLNRLAFGPTLEEFRHVRTIGVDRYIAEQLDPGSIEEPIELRWRLAQLDTLKLNPVLRAAAHPARFQAFCGAGEGPAGTRADHPPGCRRGTHSQSGIEPTPAAGGHGRFLVQPFQCVLRQGAG